MCQFVNRIINYKCKNNAYEKKHSWRFDFKLQSELLEFQLNYKYGLCWKAFFVVVSLKSGLHQITEFSHFNWVTHDGELQQKKFANTNLKSFFLSNRFAGVVVVVVIMRLCTFFKYENKNIFIVSISMGALHVHRSETCCLLYILGCFVVQMAEMC